MNAQNPQKAELFNRVLKGKNFMTPHVLGYSQIGKGKDSGAEISQGKFLKDVIYGVTVIIDGEHKPELGKCCHNMKEVEDYLNELKEM